MMFLPGRVLKSTVVLKSLVRTATEGNLSPALISGLAAVEREAEGAAGGV